MLDKDLEHVEDEMMTFPHQSMKTATYTQFFLL